MNDFAASLIKIGAIKFGHFKLKLHEKYPDAPLSPIYIDLRLLRSFPDAMKLAVNVYKELASGLEFDALADIPTAATPITSILSYIIRKPMISPRMDKKSHGTKQSIDGAFRNGDKILLIDDLITKADSKLEAIKILEDNGLIIRNILVLLDREQGGIQALSEKGYECRSGFALRNLLQFYSTNGIISKGDFVRTMEYLESA